MLRSIFYDLKNDHEIAFFSSIIVAGHNYNKSDMSYGEMRLLLRNDFEEFFRLSNESGNQLLKERILERFKVFCKIIFKEFLDHNINFNKNTEVSLINIAEWKLEYYPDAERIGGKINGY
ncbi:hypothetical protein PTI45_03943 [Paenibacillus nuruki]|uniref:Uncharacterized protein n=2 Tax=Paenibacillus nuruki TaxID=1886670 RepID=A0A1E3KYQ6_9BACL|nr:hypothetical protein PTI45_03943 [Paenibacillus nuruki]